MTDGYEVRFYPRGNLRPQRVDHGVSHTESETAVIDAASLPMEIATMCGFWLTPTDADGEPNGPTTYYPME